MAEKTARNPKGAGRPKGNDPSRQRNAPPPPADPTIVAKEEGDTIKVTPKLAEDLGMQIALAETIPYAVMARTKEDPRWNLQEEEVAMLARVWATCILVYADEIGKWIPLVAVISANVAPLAARMMMADLPKPVAGGQKPNAKDRETVARAKAA